MHVGPFTISLPGRQPKSDPLWDRFINTPPVDPNNLVATALRRVPEGAVFPVKTDVHSPEIMAQHVKQLTTFLGADACGIVRLRSTDEAAYPSAIVCAFWTDDDPRAAGGIGGQAPALEGAYVTFNLAAWIRECGYHAARAEGAEGERLAALAGIATLDTRGWLVPARGGRYAYVADVLHTDLPLAPDGEAVA